MFRSFTFNYDFGYKGGHEALLKYFFKKNVKP